MLVLSRAKDESIIIGDDIEITIVDVRGGKVRLGIRAPLNITVHRKEVYEAIQREKEALKKEALKPDEPEQEQTYYLREELEEDIFDIECDDEPDPMEEARLMDEIKKGIQREQDEMSKLPDLPV
jgi:carbon storage regulator